MAEAFHRSGPCHTATLCKHPLAAQRLPDTLGVPVERSGDRTPMDQRDARFERRGLAAVDRRAGWCTGRSWSWS